MDSDVMRYLSLAEQLLATADKFEPDRSRLSYAASVAVRLADLADTDDTTVNEWLEKAATLLAQGLAGTINYSVASSAGSYADMASTRRRKILVRDKKSDEVGI